MLLYKLITLCIYSNKIEINLLLIINNPKLFIAINFEYFFC